MGSRFLEDPGQKGLPRAFSSPAFAGVKAPIPTNQILQLATWGQSISSMALPLHLSLTLLVIYILINILK